MDASGVQVCVRRGGGGVRYLCRIGDDDNAAGRAPGRHPRR
ncbi:MAG: hypothetical protein AVDCRST_MAG41-3153 [uncultured Corynebacteriales bacterium]|uniref:Uncharacterized protein n=1 Tax=uncultured Mycobacteriales bacterium TaxID=581187 RepID=A0A6J4JAN9_9ACTN|nr:MAG: hypothetical protein AVDCRST_MAG41-3153 [uncultured Corynebacteriales bacterium]